MPGKLSTYEQEVIAIRAEGITYYEIHEVFCVKGYGGTVASLRIFMQKKRTHRKAVSSANQRNTYRGILCACYINTYILGLKKDINAVKNGIKYKYNNRLAEGSVNNIKLTKCIMYGRNSIN